MKFFVVLVFKLDRAFRSVKHMYDTLGAWEMVGVSFLSVRERFDTSFAPGRLTGRSAPLPKTRVG